MSRLLILIMVCYSASSSVAFVFFGSSVELADRNEDKSCPKTHPFSYCTGRYCCKTNKDLYGGVLTAMCNGCANDEYVDCPNFPCALNEGKEYTQSKKTSCNGKGRKRYSKLEEAQEACTKDSECKGLYDSRCDGGYYMCKGSQRKSRSSCTWWKQTNAVQIYKEMSAMCYWPDDVTSSKDLTFSSKEEAELACSKLPGCAMYYTRGVGRWIIGKNEDGSYNFVSELWKICPEGSTVYEFPSTSYKLYVIKDDYEIEYSDYLGDG